MDWLTLGAVVLAFALGFSLGRHTAPRPPRIAFYPKQETGVAIRRRLFGD